MPIIDGHNDLAWELRTRAGYDLSAIDLTQDQSGRGLHTDLPRLLAGGVGAQFWSAWVPGTLAGGAAVTATLEQIDFIRTFTARYPDHLMFATTAADIEVARASGRVGSLIGVEGGHSIDSSLAVLRMLHALGVRYLTLTHNENTGWADSATDSPGVGGLSDFGRDVVRECNRLGVLVDLSHTAVSTMEAALTVSTQPAFFSHSNARALCDHPRNVPDAVLARVRDSGGIVMVTFVPGFLTEPGRQWMEEQRQWRLATIAAYGEEETAQRWPAQLAANPRPPCGIADVVAHLNHIRAVAGIDHVGIGGDLDGTPVTPDGLTGVECYPALLTALTADGWSTDELEKLTWSNALRVLRDSQ